MADERTTDAELIERTRAGDTGAFAALCTRYEGLLQARIGPRIAGPVRRKVSVLDVLQETYLTAHDRLDDFENRGDGAFGAWLARIAELKAREAVRRFAGTKKRDAGREVSRGARKDTAEFEGAGPTPSEMAQAGERREEIRRALEALPPDYRRVLQLIQVDGLTVDAAAALLGRSREAAKKLYSRALARLAEEIDL